MITKPMLAGTVKDMKKIKYPVLVTPKLDGIRCLKIDGKAVSRNFKKIPNRHTSAWIEKYFPDGVDGELMLEGKTFQATTSAVMSEDGEPPVVYHIFDYVIDGGVGEAYASRCSNLKRIETRDIPKHLYKLILPVIIQNEEELLEIERDYLGRGYEGVMLRSIDGPYKCGRSTVGEGFLLKLKRFQDSEAVVVGFEERMHNSNVAEKDAFGRTKRSMKKEGMVPSGTLGALVVKDGAVEFRVGTGFSDEQRAEIWGNKDKYLGQLVKYKHQPTGVKEAPRFPVFLGFRHPNDGGE